MLPTHRVDLDVEVHVDCHWWPGVLGCALMTVVPIPGITAKQAAVILDVTPRYVDRLVSDGKLPKAVRHAKAGLDRDVVERVSLDRLRRSRPHRYWASSQEAAEILDLTRKQVGVLASLDQVPAVRHRGRWYFRRHQLEVVANARDAMKWADT